MSNLDAVLAAFEAGGNELDLLPSLFNFLICIAMSFVVRELYVRRSFSLTGKNHIGSILPILSAVVFLVIIVVKSSLALSLGLVGALSIVRFRTPIKEPEELVYLFLAIALGLGYGAGHTLLTTLFTMIILGVIFFWLSNRRIRRTSEFNMVIHWSGTDVRFEDLVADLEPKLVSLKVIRLDWGDVNNTAVLLVIPEQNQSLGGLVESLRDKVQGLRCSFFEAKTNW